MPDRAPRRPSGPLPATLALAHARTYRQCLALMPNLRAFVEQQRREKQGSR